MMSVAEISGLLGMHPRDICAVIVQYNVPVRIWNAGAGWEIPLIDFTKFKTALNAHERQSDDPHTYI